MVKPQIAIAVLLLCLFNQGYSQYAETINSDRPGQAISAATVGSRVLQVQTGLAYTHLDDTYFDWKNLASETVLRFGILSNFEVNALVNYRQRYFTNLPNRDEIDAFQLGIRYQIYPGKGPIPSIAFQYQVELVDFPNAFDYRGIGSSFRIATAQSLSKRLSLATNLGLNFSSSARRPQAVYIVNLGYALSDRWAVFGEFYGTDESGAIPASLDGGLSFRPTPHILLDVSAGWGKRLALTQRFISAGISARIPRRR